MYGLELVGNCQVIRMRMIHLFVSDYFPGFFIIFSNTKIVEIVWKHARCALLSND